MASKVFLHVGAPQTGSDLVRDVLARHRAAYPPAQDPPGTPRWPWAQDDCPAYRDADYPAQGHRRAAGRGAARLARDRAVAGGGRGSLRNHDSGVANSAPAKRPSYEGA